MADKTYGLYPFAWHPPEVRQVISDGVPIEVTITGYHSAPSGSLCVLDLRPIPQQSIQGQSGGYGFFAWEGAVPNDLIVLGVGDCRSIVSTPAMRTELQSKLGLAQQPSGATLIDLIYDCLGPLAVPDGSTGVRPLMPTSSNDLEIHLSGHSLVKSLKFNPAILLAANPTGHANKIRDVIRTNLDIADAVGKLPEALGHWLMRCGYSRAKVKAGAPGKKVEYDRLCSAAVKAKYGSDLKPREPKTSFTETWPTNGDIRSGGQDQVWTCHDGPSFDVYLNAVSGSIRCSSGGAGYWYNGTCSSPVSSADHWVDGRLWMSTNYAAGVTARHVAGAETCYAYLFKRHLSERHLVKWVSGTETQLSNALVSPNPTDFTDQPWRCQANGSTISGIAAPYSTLSVTDTTLSGTLTGGALLSEQGTPSGSLRIGAWSIDDGVAAAPVAAFTGTPLTGTAPLSVAFTDASTNTPTSWLWEKSSDGGSNWANFASGPTTQNPTESFTAGTWAVRLTATNAGGADSETKLAYVAVTAAGGAGVSALMLVRGFV